MIKKEMEKEIVVLVADKNMEFAIKGMFLRFQALGIRQLNYDCYVHPEHDPGCLLRGTDFLRPFVNRYKHALIILDYEGCGREHLSSDRLEHDLDVCLAQSGWGDRAKAIIINPELEAWVWSNSPLLEALLGWVGTQPDLRGWLMNEGYIENRLEKPKHPKKAVEQVLKRVGKARSSSIYFQIAKSVSFERCRDLAFLKLKNILKVWFSN